MEAGGLETGDEGELVDLLLRPVAQDDPLRPVLQRDLEERLEHIAPRRGEDTAERAATWLAGLTPMTKRGKLRRKLALPAVAVAVVIFCAAFEIRTLLPVVADMQPASSRLYRETQEDLYALPPGEVPDGAPLTGYETRSPDGSRNAWLAHPEDPVLYYAYTHRLPWISQPLPEDYEKTWRRIDPDNGAWALRQAAALLEGGASAPERERALALVREAAEKPRLASYRSQWMAYVEASRRPVRTAAQLLFWQGQQSNLWDSFSPVARGLSEELQLQLRALPATASEAAAYRKVQRWAAEEADRSVASSPRRSEDGAEMRPSIWMVCRWATLGLAAVFLAGAGVAELRLLPARGLPGKLGDCLGLLERRGDLAAVVAWGLPVPLALGVASFAIPSPDRLTGLLLLCMPALMLLAMLVPMVVAADWKVSRQTGFLGFASSPLQRWIGIVMAGLALLGLAAGSAILVAQNHWSLRGSLRLETLLVVCGVPAGLALLWLMLKLLLGYSSPDAGVRHRLIARRLVPAFLMAAILLGLAALGVLHPLERAAVREVEVLKAADR